MRSGIEHYLKHPLYVFVSSDINSCSSIDDVFFDAESIISPPSSRLRSGNKELDVTHEDNYSAIRMHPSFASLSSLRNVDESLGSDDDDLVTAAVEEGIITIPGGQRACSSINSVSLMFLII